MRTCGQCLIGNGECEVCQTAGEVRPNTDDNSHPAGEGGRRKRAKIAQAADMVNMHELGKNFVERVIDVRQEKVSWDTEAGTTGHLEFQCRIRGWQKDTRALTRTSLLQLSNAGLRLHLVHSGRGIIFRLPTEMWPGSQTRYQTGGWWYVALEEVTFRECPQCSDRVPEAGAKSSEGRRRGPRQCETCGTERAGMSRRRPQTTRTGSSKVSDKQSRLRRSFRRDVNYIERGID